MYIYILCSYAIREKILGHLVEFIYHNAWFNLESSRGHTQITCFRGLDIGARCFYFCFSFLKLWNFIWSIQFTCNKCGIRKLKYMFASLMLFLSLYISIRSTSYYKMILKGHTWIEFWCTTRNKNNRVFGTFLHNLFVSFIVDHSNKILLIKDGIFIEMLLCINMQISCTLWWPKSFKMVRLKKMCI